MRKVSLQFTVYSLQLKKFLCFSGILWAFVILGCVKWEITNTDSKGRNIICFGDSLTYGYGVESGQDYPSALAKLTDIPVINAGIDGDISIEALKRIKSDILEKDPFIVLIEFGGNDFLRKIPKETTVNNIKEMIAKIQARGAMAAIVDISTGMFLSEYRIALRNLAQEKRAIFIPSVLSGIITNPSLKSDFLHPNADGYKLIAQRVFRAIQPYLKQR